MISELKKEIEKISRGKKLQINLFPASLFSLLNEATSFLKGPSLSERMYCVANDLHEPPLCDGGNPLSFINFQKGYYKRCSLKTCSCWKLNPIKKTTHTPEQKQEINNKIIRTVRERYGVDNVFQLKEVKEKLKQTLVDIYGVDNVSKADEVKLLKKEKSKERYGVDNVSKADEVKEKIRASFQERYGVDNPMQIKEIRDQHSKALATKALGVDLYQILSSIEWWEKNYIGKKGVSLTSLADAFGISSSCLSSYASKLGVFVHSANISMEHQKIIDLLSRLGVDFVINDRSKIPPKELDIYIPEYNLAIEVNGIWCHVESDTKDKFYHRDKTKACESIGIRLLHFWDYEINNKFEIIESMIVNILNRNEKKIGARKTTVNIISKQTASIFFDENHIQGGEIRSSINYGLFYNDECVCVASFSRPRFSRKADLELIRFASKRGWTIAGGLSKILSVVRANHSIVSYSDSRYSEGKLYSACGFTLMSVNDPGYQYTKNGKTVYHRNYFQKKRIAKLFPSVYDESKTEQEMMEELGFKRLWDCGTKKWFIQKTS